MKYLVKNKTWRLTDDYNIDKLLYLLVDRPDKIDIDGDLWWKKEELSNRDYDLPTSILFCLQSIMIYWDKNNQIHREGNKPAFIKNNGVKEYATNGKYNTFL